MAFRLSKSEQKQHTELHKALHEAEERVKMEFSAMLERLKEATVAVNDAIRERNTAASAAADFVTGIADQWDSDHGDKSEGWQEGEKGQAVRDLIDEWQGIGFEDIEEVEIVEPEIEDSSYAAEAFGELRAEAE